MDDATPPDFKPISEDVLLLVKPDLRAGERLLWAARSSVDAWAARDAERSAMWVVVAAFAGVGGLCLGSIPIVHGSWKAGLNSGVFVVGVIALIVASFVVVGIVASRVESSEERRSIRGQVYALTDRRAIIYVPDIRTGALAVHTISKGTIKVEDVHRVQYPDGSGDVAFRGGSSAPSGFRGVEDVRRVEELVRRFLVAPAPIGRT